MDQMTPVVIALICSGFVCMCIAALALGKMLREHAKVSDAHREQLAIAYEAKAVELDQDADFIEATFPSIASETRRLAKHYHERAEQYRRRIV